MLGGCLAVFATVLQTPAVAQTGGINSFFFFWGSILKILETHCGIREMELLLILDDFWKRFCNGVLAWALKDV